MKRYGGSVWCLLTLPVLIFTGCLEVNVGTTISADGSSERVIRVKRPSMELLNTAFPVPTDSSWSVEWKETGTKEQRYEYIARKSFATPEELRQEYAAIPDSGILGIDVSVKTTFAWFYTYVDYREVFTFRNPFGNVPISDYLTKEEIERFMCGEKGDSLKKKVDRWFMRDMFEEFYRPLIVEAEQLNDTTLRVSLLEEKREDVFDRAMMSDSSEKGVDDVDQALHLIAEVLGRGDVRILHPAAQNAWDTIEKKLNRMSSADGQYVYSVQMPGLILDTNSDAVEGTTASWKFEAEQFHVGDIVMHASSRVTNVWAFVVTALVVLIAGIIAVPVILRRRS